MERVQFQQEQMLAELKDLVQKGLFTQKEVKQIMKKRTAFETALVRRVAKKNDYLRYAAYEMGLEALRKKRVDRLKLPKQGTSVSDYALVRRQFHIFERALKKFKSDVGLWIQYIQLAKKEGARSLVGRICARALQLHPHVPSLYILAAQHELAHLSPSAARVLLQRGIRLNAESVDMWREYVRFELGFVESMRRRWELLGIDVNGKGKAKAQEEVEEGMDEREVDQMQMEADGEGDESEQARREIMQGAIVKSVISNAVKALPKAALFVSVHELLSSYPTTPSLRSSLLDHLHSHLQQTLPTDPVAVRLTATRNLTASLSGPALVDALKDANEKMTAAVRAACSDDSHKDAEGMARSYAEFVAEWVKKGDVDDSLKAYLLTSLHMLVQRLLKSSSAPAPLLATELSLLTTETSLHPLLPFTKNIVQLATKYTASPAGKADAHVWLARLEVEKAFADNAAQLQKSAREARALVQGEDVVDVWLWGINVDDVQDEDSAIQILKSLEELLSESMRMQDAPSFRLVHTSLLVRCATALKVLSSHTARLAHFRRLAAGFLLDGTALRAFFDAEAARAGAESKASDALLREVFQAWRRRDVADAALAWARWLLAAGQGREAAEVVQRARAEVEGADKLALEEAWRRFCDESTQRPEEGEVEDDDAMDQD
ncbi:hypothetical protein PsYK624_111930 [Phanerochaete sordida]|uniref:U3 small nucleolar RNA-associated protein 6 N-terminal domain-containing protein n=1 Tax=Phanerochaete sordida TaxID=48140 RepID=A0A9P3GK67_9APHY|nr:hypothetical protein PsYK624_111930 [Phanerochaete sordida]